MGKKSLCLLIASVLIAYYVYNPLPENNEEGWKLMLIDAGFRTLGHMAGIAEKLGLAHYMETMMMLTYLEYAAPVSDEKVTVTDTKMNDVPVRLYVPKEKPDSLKRAVIFIHGGGWCLGGTAMSSYDLLSRWTSERLNAVVISIEYRLAPKYHFPVQFEDVYAVTKYFLQRSVLEEHKVDPERVCISGDSAGGNLAAAVTQQLLDDPDVKVKLKIQVLIYPALQTIDMNLPSYQDNKNMPILPKSLMLRFWSEYFTTDLSLMEAIETNQYVPPEFSHLFKFVNWSEWLPERFKRDHVYTSPVPGKSKFGQKYPGFFDPRAAPLLVDDVKLRGLPLTYVITCQHDVLRDDGLMYVSRLRKVGVPVIHEHLEGAIHGMLLMNSGPLFLNGGQIAVNNYIEWLNKNL
ncbi:arylacetamide deacetylase [Anolis carolinensis]|uniref:Arylacetamide deacetylase n=1 Tax=Anolis carolinensis TaxID=28377 RepID=G1KH99_ANOCA|nr:PREDICTED: arylacetamide deacetylase [Anolis carolinensis]|eukprot:XP_003218232.1 PREDICTED: arylacetamide deacetylase [Anolis carolinensis]